MKSFFSSRISKLHVLMVACTLGMPVLSFPVIASAQNSCITTASGEVVCGNPTTKPASTTVDLTGIWDMQAKFDKFVASDGFIKNTNIQVVDYVMELHSSVGNTLTGKIIGAQGPGGNFCQNAVIDGNIKARAVNYTWVYMGSCCPNEAMNFSGEIDSQGVLRGKLKPVKIPTSNCSLAYGTLTGTKRTGL